MQINGGLVREELKEKGRKCHYCKNEAKYVIKTEGKEVYVCEECNNKI